MSGGKGARRQKLRVVERIRCGLVRGRQLLDEAVKVSQTFARQTGKHQSILPK